MLLRLFFTIACSSVLIDATFITRPVSLNTSLNSNVTFTCEATNVSVILFYVNGTPAVNDHIVERGFNERAQETINGTIKKRQLLVHAREINNNTIIYCTGHDLMNIMTRSDDAILTIQGLLNSVRDLSYTFVNGSSVLLTWTAPYTLDNVPITGYYIFNGLVDITTTNNNYTLSATNPDPCILSNIFISPINDVGIGSSNTISFYYETVPLIVPPVSVVPVIDGQLISLNISVNVSTICKGEYPNSITVNILNTDNNVITINSIIPQVNDQLMITGVITVPNNLNTFIVNVSLSNNGGEFLHPPFGFGFLINSSIDNCFTIDIAWTALPTVDDRVSIQYYILRIYDAIAGSLVDVVSVSDTSYQFVDDNLFINRYTYVITGVNELGEGISSGFTFSYQRVPRSAVENTTLDILNFTEDTATVLYNIPVIIECTGEAPENATVTIQCNGTGIVYDNATLVEKAKQPMNITGSVLIPLNQQCNISIVFSNEAGSSEPFVLALNTFPPNDTTSLPTDGTVTSSLIFISVLIATIVGGTGIAVLIVLIIIVVLVVVVKKRKLTQETQNLALTEEVKILKMQDSEKNTIDADGNAEEADAVTEDLVIEMSTESDATAVSKTPTSPNPVPDSKKSIYPSLEKITL